MDYFRLKYIHILSATLLFGTGLGTAFHGWFAIPAAISMRCGGEPECRLGGLAVHDVCRDRAADNEGGHGIDRRLPLYQRLAGTIDSFIRNRLRLQAAGGLGM